MRKFVALALVVAMMLVMIPTAFAAAGDAAVMTSAWKYYDADKAAVTGTVNGPNVYVSNKFSNFANWQIPGNVLTGNAGTWGTWIEVTATIFVKGAYSEIYIDGYKYPLTATTYNGATGGKFVITYYTAPVEGGNTSTRTLTLSTVGGVVIDRVAIATIYQDIYKLSGSVSTEGINQANTYAYIDGGDIAIDIVYKNLVPEYTSTNPANAGYLQPKWFPIRVKVALLDKDGAKYPAFTRVDVEDLSGHNNKNYYYVGTVPNYGSVLYLTEDSTFGFEKRLLPGNTAFSADALLELYKAYAVKYGVLATEYVTYALANEAALQNANGVQASINKAIGAQADIAVAASASVGALNIQAALTGAVGPTNALATSHGLLNAYAQYLKDAVTLIQTGGYLGTDPANVATLLSNNATYAQLLVDSDAALAIAAANYTYANDATALTKLNAIAAIIRDVMTQYGVAAARVPTLAGYNSDVDALAYFSLNYHDYMDQVNALKADNISINDLAVKVFQEKDTFTLRLTKPNGDTSTQGFTVTYNSVTRIVAKSLTSLQGTSITLKVGETKDVTVAAYQDQVPVTGLPIKFVSNDASIATATSPNTQTVNSNVTTITGVKVGTTFVKAYLDTTNDKAEAYIMVNVVAEETVAPATTTDYVCRVRKLWIRSGAGTSNSQVGYYSRNDVAKVYEVVNGWAKVDYNGSVAYSSTGNGKYLSPK